MPLTEILAKLFRWTSLAWGALRRRKAGTTDRHRFDLGSIPARIEAEKLSITIGQLDGVAKGRKTRRDASKAPKA